MSDMYSATLEDCEAGWAVVGRYVPTDANPEDAAGPTVAILFESREQAESWDGRLWYPDSQVVEVIKP